MVKGLFLFTILSTWYQVTPVARLAFVLGFVMTRDGGPEPPINITIMTKILSDIVSECDVDQPFQLCYIPKKEGCIAGRHPHCRTFCRHDSPKPLEDKRKTTLDIIVWAHGNRNAMSMKPAVLVTGSSGHLGKALMLSLPELGYNPIGIDINSSNTTTHIGSITDPSFLSNVFSSYNIAHVIHAATLHKPHICSHSKAEFVQTNIAGTLALLEVASSSPNPSSPVKSFIYISTTSAFGTSLSPPEGSPAAWINDDTPTTSHKNIYGLTKSTAEDLCQLIAKEKGLPTVVLRTSRFFPEEDDDEARRAEVPDEENLKVLELAYRRVDVADVVSACVCAMERCAEGTIRWGKFIVSAPTPFGREDLDALSKDAEGVLRGLRVGVGVKVGEVFDLKRWKFLRRIDRVYDSSRAIRELGWRPEYTFERAVEKVAKGEEWKSELTRRIGRLGYHAVSVGVYTKRDDKEGGSGQHGAPLA